MLYSRYNMIRTFIVSVTLLIMITLSGCEQTAQYEKGSALDVFDYTTIYYLNTKEDAVEELGKTKVYLDIGHSEEQKDVLNKRTKVSIRDLGGLDIEVDNNNHTMYVSSDIEGKAFEVYKAIINTLENEKSKYLTLYRSLEFGEDGKIVNITFNETESKIKFDFTRTGELVDTRFLDIVMKDRKDIKESDVESMEETLKLLNECEEGNRNYVIFKSDAIYGTACSEIGQKSLMAVQTLTNKEFIIQETGKIFQGITMESMLNSITDKRKTFEGIEKLELITIDKKEDFENEVTVYFEEETQHYKDDLNAIFESLGYKINETESRESCDLIIGYTWLYNSNIQSSFDDTLNEAIMNHVNGSNTESNTEFIVRSSWILGR